jgi:DNA-binding LacI/PurR family transcriptional regulator
MKEIGAAPGMMIEADDYSVEAGIRAAEKVAGLKRKPTALLGMNDMVSAGLLQGLLSLGLRIPEDYSIVGFDDTFVTGITTPNLTSVGYDYQAYGSMLVRAAVDPEPFVPEEYRIPVFITERNSCLSLT